MKPRASSSQHSFSAADLERTWRGPAYFVGPVGPPMLLAMRQPGYNDWLRRLTFTNKPGVENDSGWLIDDDEPEVEPGAQLELQL